MSGPLGGVGPDALHKEAWPRGPKIWSLLLTVPLGEGPRLPEGTGTFSDSWEGAPPARHPRKSCPLGPYGGAHACRPRGQVWLHTPLHCPPPAGRPLTSGREEMDSKLMRFSARVGDRPLGRRQLLAPSDSLRPFPCSKRTAIRPRGHGEPVPSAPQRDSTS